MPKFPKPFFRRDRGRDRGWFVQIGKQQVKLADGPENKDTEAAALKRYHEVMTDACRDKSAAVAPVADGLTIAEVFDKFLDWTEKHRERRTFEWYRDHIQSFMDTLSRPGTMPAMALKPSHVVEWADKHGNWSNAYRRGAIIAIQRPFNWADELGYISGSPIKKPKPQRRDNHLSPEDFTEIIGNYAEGDRFRDLIHFAWASGCRPQEASQIEPRHVRLETKCIIIPEEEAKGKRRERIIHLQGPALEIIVRLSGTRKSGKLFVNEDGRPWNRFAIANRFDRLHLNQGLAKLKELGINVEPLPRFNHRKFTDTAQLLAARKEHQLKVRERRKQILKLARQHSVKFALYDARHGFANRLLINGIDHVTVAALMGHADGTQVARTYQHVDKRQDYLKKVLEAST